MISLQEGRGTKAKGAGEDPLSAPGGRGHAAACLEAAPGTRDDVALRLHDSIQIAFDWFDYQTHAFALDELKFGNPVKRDDVIIEDDRDVTLGT